MDVLVIHREDVTKAYWEKLVAMLVTKHPDVDIKKANERYLIFKIEGKMDVYIDIPE